MCGIFAAYSRESKFDLQYIDTLFASAEKRGQDGCGYVLIKKNPITKKREIIDTYRNVKSYSNCKDDIELNLKNKHGGEIGDLILGICRAAPESEPATDPDKIVETLQPIVNQEHRLAVIHNGAVSNKIHQELKDWTSGGEYTFNTQIDSESIIASYIKHQKHIVNTMEYLSGGFSVLLFDEQQDRLYMINDFKPLSWGYVRGLGLMIHSNLDPIEKVTYDVTNCSRCGIALWEDFYFHPISGPRVQSIDLQSGFVRKQKYSPRYLTQTWDSNAKLLKSKEVV
jgi:glucosamine 6-phosphate synthetase-like amidotransferase/phosphosugar isomerase protein